MQKTATLPILLLVLAVVLVSMGAASTQDDPCTREAVIASFAEAVARGDVEGWAQRYADNGCSMQIMAGIRALAAAFDLMAPPESVQTTPETPTPAPQNTPQPSPTPDVSPTPSAEPLLADEVEPLSYPLLIARAGARGLYIINLSPAAFPLKALRLGEGDDAIDGAAWEVETLALRECVVVGNGSDLQQPDEDCTVVGAPLTLDERHSVWQGALSVYFDGVAAGICDADAELCFVIAAPPAATPTPLPPIAYCPGAPPSQLAVGAGARAIGGNRDLLDRPGGARTVTLLETAPFTIVGGPECASNQVWWQVQTANGITGWIAERAGDQTQVEFCPLVAVPDYGVHCPDAQPSRVRVGQDRLRVITPGLRLRAEPGLSGPVFGNLNFYEVLIVTGGPACADGSLWWEVQATASRRAGWVAESTNREWHTVPDPWLGCQME